MTYKYNFNKLNGRIIERFKSKKNFAEAIGAVPAEVFAAYL